MEVIKNGRVVDDGWVYVADDEALPDGDIIVSSSRLRAERDALRSRAGGLGVRLKSDELPSEIADELPQLSLVAVEFPKYVDGRGYSTARVLRERYGFSGELRAVGNVLPDQLFYMRRCGFDAFELERGKRVETALSALQAFSVTYQAAADDPRPLYRRR